MRARARIVALVALVALASAGCADVAGPPPRTAVAPSGEDWNAVARTVEGRWDGESQNVCRRGERTCLDLVIAEMTRRFDALAAACDRRAAFALMYLRVTERVRADGDRLFDDRRYLNHFDAVFAQLYFEPFDAWQAGRRDSVPEAWRIAFRASDEGTVSALGDLMLGMNAHISRDLPFVLETIGLETPSGRSAESDFDRVNEILTAVQGPLLVEVAGRLDPTIASMSVPMLSTGPVDLAQLLAVWRTEAYDNAERLITAGSRRARAVVVDSIEQRAADRAKLIRVLTSYRLAGGTPSERDEFCRSRPS